MRIAFTYLFLLLSMNAVSQRRLFTAGVEELLEKQDSYAVIEDHEVTSNEYDFTTEGTNPLELLFLSELKSTAKKSPDELKTSATLLSISELATKCWRGSHYADSKKWGKLHKYFKRASNKSTSRFNIIKEVSFRIPLVDRDGKKFYYDRNGQAGELNLFEGEKPKSKQEREEAEEIPLSFFSEEELLENLMRYTKKKRIYRDLRKGVYSYVGVSIVVDKNTLYKNKIPTARVVLIVGARRMRLVRAMNLE